MTAPVPPIELFNQLILSAIMLCGLSVGCEFLKDDMKLVYQTVLLILDAALFLLLGAYSFMGIDNAGTTYTDGYMGAVMFFFGGILLVIVCMKLLIRPNDQPGPALAGFGEGSEFQTPPRQPKQPMRRGGV